MAQGPAWLQLTATCNALAETSGTPHTTPMGQASQRHRNSVVGEEGDFPAGQGFGSSPHRGRDPGYCRGRRTLARSVIRGWGPGSPRSGLVRQGPGGGLPRMTGRVWLLSSALGVVCGGKSTLRSQNGAAGGSSSPSSSPHCHREPGGPIPALAPAARLSCPGLAYLPQWGRGPRASGRDSLAHGGGQRLPERAQLWEPALGLGSVPPSSLRPRETEPGQQEAQKYNVLLKKSGLSWPAPFSSAWWGSLPTVAHARPSCREAGLDPSLAPLPLLSSGDIRTINMQ